MKNMEKYVPDRKWVASGISGVLTWAVISFTGLSDPEVASAVIGGVMAVVHYLVPASVNDILKNLDKVVQNAADLGVFDDGDDDDSDKSGA